MLHHESDSREMIKHLDSRAGHKAIVHNRQFVRLFGSVCLLLGLTSCSLSMVLIFQAYYLKAFCFGCLCLTALLWGSMIVFLYSPCSCSPKAILSYRAKQRLRGVGTRRSRLEAYSVALLVVLLIGLSFVFMGISMSFMVLSALCFLSGFALLSRSRTEQSEGHYPLIKPEERIFIESLAGDSEDDLARMVDYYLKLGDFEMADRASKKLLLLADRD